MSVAKTRAPRCSSGTRSDHNPRLPSTIEGEADSSMQCRPLNGCGRDREPQSMLLSSIPGIAAFYSGLAMTKASAASSRRRSSTLPAGMPS